jgi:antitoxin CptB
MLDSRNTVALTHRVPPWKASKMSDNDIDTRRRRALWRATHRGYKEMDFLLGRFATQMLEEMDAVEIGVFERLIDTPDPQIEISLFQGQTLGAPDLDELMARLRRFHGMNEAG